MRLEAIRKLNLNCKIINKSKHINTRVTFVVI